MANTLSPFGDDGGVLLLPPGDLAHEVVVDAVVAAVSARAGATGAERVGVALHHPAGQLALGGPDRAAVRAVQLDGEVGDPARGDVRGDVDLAATHDALVDDAATGGGVEAGVGRGQSGLGERVQQVRARLGRVDPAEELPDREEVLDVVDQRGAGQRHHQRLRRERPDPVGELEDVPGTLRRLVLDEMRLVDDHTAESEVAEPPLVAVEHLVVDDHDVGEAVDGVAVTVDRGGLAARRPQPGLPHPVRLDDVRHDDEQRERVRRLRREQGLGRLAQSRLVGEQERPMARRSRGDQTRLVRHQLLDARHRPAGRLGEAHAHRGPRAGALERAQQRPEQLPPGQRRGTGPARPRRREVGGEERVGHLARHHRLRHHLGLGRRGERRLDRRRGLLLFDRRLDARLAQHVPPQRPGRVGDDRVLVEQRQQPLVADGGHRQGPRGLVEPFEPFGALLLTDLAVGPDPHAFLAQHQGDGLELRARRRGHPPVAQGGLDLLDGAPEHRHHVVGGTTVPLGASASPRLGPASSSHVLLLLADRVAGPWWPRRAHTGHGRS